MEVGKYIDFHANNTTKDNDVRITAETTGLTISGTTKGTFSGNLSGNASTATKATSADSATKATSANKLTTARTVSGGTDIRLSFNYDGSGNSSASIGYYSCNGSVGNTNNYPWHRFASYGPFSGAWCDVATLFYVAQDYNGGGFGLFRISLRTNSDSSSMHCEVRWLVRSGISADQVQIAYYPNASSAYADVFFKTQGSYAGFTMRAIASGYRAGINSTWKLISSNEDNGTTTSNKGSSYECWASIASAGTALHGKAYTGSAVGYNDGGVNTANTAGTADSATTSNGVKDYNDGNKTIRIGFAGAGLNTSNLSYLAGFTDNGTKIKDVSKDVLKSWIGLGNYLPLSGGTMTGNIAFSDIGNTNTSNKISWNGSTDGADIYYQTTASDQGNLVLNLRDDSNCYLRIAKNGSFKSYFSPDDGNFHGNVNGNCYGYADYVYNVGIGGNMRFNWSGQSGQPTWLWGSNNGKDVYVWNPSNFSVNWATNAGNGVESSGSGYIRFRCGVQICWGSSGAVTTSSGTNNFPVAFNSATYGVTMNAFNKKVDYGITITNKTTTYFSWGKNGAAPNGDVWIAVGT